MSTEARKEALIVSATKILGKRTLYSPLKPLPPVFDPKRLRTDFSEIEMETATEKELLLQLLEKVTRIETKLEAYNNRVEAAEARISAQDKIIEKQARQLHDHGNTIFQLEKIVERIYSEGAKNNLIVKGLKSKANNDLGEELVQHFRKLGAKRRPIMQRVQKISQNATLVSFNHYSDKMYLLTKAKRMQEEGIRIEEDLTPRQREEKNMLLKQRREILDNGVAKTVKIFKNSLLLDDSEWFDYDRSTGLISKRQRQ